MADELELELSYEGDPNADYGGEEVDYGESEGEEQAAPSHQEDDQEKDETADARDERRGASNRNDRKVC